MCNKIDESSKEFLQFLLKVPVLENSLKNPDNNRPFAITSGNKCAKCSRQQNKFPNASKVSSIQSSEANRQNQMLKVIRKKQRALNRLLKDYRQLSQINTVRTH